MKNVEEQRTDFIPGQWLYILDKSEKNTVELLFRFKSVEDNRWPTDEHYQVVNGKVYPGKGVTTTDRPVEVATQEKIEEVLSLAARSKGFGGHSGFYYEDRALQFLDTGEIIYQDGKWVDILEVNNDLKSET